MQPLLNRFPRLSFTRSIMKLQIRSVLFYALILLSFKLQAEVVLPALISDNMVIQRDTPVHIWGTASIGEKVTVSLLNQTKSAITDDQGKWQLWLDPVSTKASTKMTVSGANHITINNILVGEVWFAAGQSNMEWDVSQSDNADEEIAKASYPELRVFDAVRSFSDTAKDEIQGKWVICSPETIKNITAVGYFFARDVHKQLRVPIGLIEASWGATRCEAWTPLAVQEKDPRLSYWQAKWDEHLRTLPVQKNTYEKKLEVWKKESEAAKSTGKRVPRRPEEPKALNKSKPSVIYNGVVAPISKYTIRGVIWYQGENNAYKDEAFPYRYLFQSMIESWRNAWNQGSFPFIFAQLSTLSKHPYWPVLRESQTEALKLHNTGMAVTYDIGDSTDAHYKNKQAVGLRMGLAALKLVYGKNIGASGPTFKQSTLEGGAIRIWFDHAVGLKSSSGVDLKGFEIAGDDGVLYPARAVVEGETVLLSCPQVAKPLIARYAFKDAPVANLINGTGLPALPFRTDVKDGL